MTREYNRRPLCERENPLSSDVADAIEELVREGGDLPVAMNREHIADKLLDMASIDDAGARFHVPRIFQDAARRQLIDKLYNSALLQAGYRHYEKRSENPVVPITEFFFKNIYGEGDDLTECLHALDAFSIRMSLPKRSSHQRNNDGEVIYGADNQPLLEKGEVYGIVVFPPNSSFDLLRAWLERRGNVAVGQLTSTTQSIRHARPESPRVTELEETTHSAKSKIGRALPRPRRIT
jgi:hypothetical protein